MGKIFYNKITKVADAVSTNKQQQTTKMTTKVEGKYTGCIRGHKQGHRRRFWHPFVTTKPAEKGILIFKHILMYNSVN